tara:strand:- start:29 stop:253 length:225 start_codon:yes stop_codon:yes gene_type:complete
LTVSKKKFYDMQFRFKDTTTTEYLIEADTEEEAIKILDEIWWTKQKSINEYREKKKVIESNKIWIEFEIKKPTE